MAGADEDRRPVPVLALAAACSLYLTQVMVGASNIWFELATPLRILHLALASAVWAALFTGVVYRHLAPQQKFT